MAKKISFGGIVFLVFAGSLFGQTQPENPFTKGKHPWLIRTVYGTEVCTVFFAPGIKDIPGSLYIFSADWEDGDDFEEGMYLLSGNTILITSEELSWSTAFRFAFLDDEHFVFYYPITVLHYDEPQEVIYWGEATVDR